MPKSLKLYQCYTNNSRTRQAKADFLKNRSVHVKMGVCKEGKKEKSKKEKRFKSKALLVLRVPR